MMNIWHLKWQLQNFQILQKRYDAICACLAYPLSLRNRTTVTCTFALTGITRYAVGFFVNLHTTFRSEEVSLLLQPPIACYAPQYPQD